VSVSTRGERVDPVTDPEPPVNVRLILANGNEKAVQTIYMGQVRGHHLWRVVGEPASEVIGMRADKLPPHTGVELRF
jgi:hypothetical protein